MEKLIQLFDLSRLNHSWKILFQFPVSPNAEQIQDVHNNIVIIEIIILTIVGWLLFELFIQHSLKKNEYYYVYYNSYNEEIHKDIKKQKWLEFIWTIIPALILVIIGYPTLVLLFEINTSVDPSITIKAIGHQWYWSYEYSDGYSTIAFDSNMIPDDLLKCGEFRLLDVDRRMVVPANTHIRLLVTSTDVIHSFTVPAFGFKIDAIPGRLNQIYLYIKKEGIYYGQCSEICGENHAKMPIVVDVMNPASYLQWWQFENVKEISN